MPFLEILFFVFIVILSIFLTPIFLFLSLLYFIYLLKKRVFKKVLILITIQILSFIYFSAYFNIKNNFGDYEFSVKKVIKNNYYVINIDELNKNAVINVKGYKLYKYHKYRAKLQLKSELHKNNISREKLMQFGTNIFYTAQLKSKIKHLGKDKRLKSLLIKKREQLIRRIDKRVRGVVATLVFGDKNWLDLDLKKLIYKSSIIHLFVISGMHIGVLILLLSYILNYLISKRWLRLFLLTLIISLYAVSVNFSASIIRTLFMFYLFSLSFELERVYNRLNSLLVTAVVVVLIWPYMIFNLGFYFSFMATLGILLYLEYFNYNIENRLLNQIKNSIFVSLFAVIFTAPVSLYFFSKFSIMAILYTIMISPVIEFLLINSYITVFTIKIKFLNDGFVWITNLSIDLVKYLLKFFNKYDVVIRLNDTNYSITILVFSYFVIASILVVVYQYKNRLYVNA